jgi:hypothetical protein
MNIHVEKRIKAFATLGAEIKNVVQELELNSNEVYRELLLKIVNNNPWFTPENVKQALSAIAQMLNEQDLSNWLNQYLIKDNATPKNIGVIMAGNVPAVGFHDALCVLLSGNNLIAKLSSQDLILLPFILDKLINIEPQFSEKILLTSGQLNNIDAIIATGSNNTSRYFEYYFSKYPNIIRKNRSSVAVISGNETNEELANLLKDALSYFGLGCRNVSKIFFPEDWNPSQLLDISLNYSYLKNHSKYFNNYEYNKAIYLINGVNHLDNGFLLLKEDEGLHAPIGVIYYEKYKEISSLKYKLANDISEIQCIVSGAFSGISSISFGNSQAPQLTDYADGVDTMEFLTGIMNNANQGLKIR